MSIIIPTRNGLDLLKPCIDSIRAAPHDNVEILVVDNNSDDPNTIAYMKNIEADGIARIIPFPYEFNFSTINNVAAAGATGEILCFLNNDTEVLAAKWLARARALLALDEVGIVGARLLYPDDTIQHFGVTLGMGPHGIAGHNHLGVHRNDAGYFGKPQLIQEFSAVTAACLFISKALFQKIGGFTPELRVNYNDVDLCLKVRAEGLKVVCDPEILLRHKESKTRGKDGERERKDLLDREAELMRQRWPADVLATDPHFSPNHSLMHADFALATLPRTPMPWRRAPKRAVPLS